eukprot:Awhi_evm1s10109
MRYHIKATKNEKKNNKHQCEIKKIIVIVIKRNGTSEAHGCFVKVEAIFKQYDADGDGSICQEEFNGVLDSFPFLDSFSVV